MISDLLTKKCDPCESSAGKVTADETGEYLKQVPGWQLNDNQLVRTFNFKNYYEALAFVNATAWISHRADHHPDMEVGFNKVIMRYSTHKVGGLTENDFICAAKINALLNL
jgi:4a-hydroxytetrahydrobiopterin dehydratase